MKILDYETKDDMRNGYYYIVKVEYNGIIRDIIVDSLDSKKIRAQLMKDNNKQDTIDRLNNELIGAK